MNRNAVGTFSNMMENVATENDLPDTTGHIFNIDGSIVRINKKRASVTTGKGSKSVRVLASGEKCESIRVIACCDAAIQFLPPVLVCKGVNKKQEFGDDLYLGSYMYTNQ